MACVLDACALISYLNDEPGCDIVDSLLKKAVDGEIDVYMNIINLIEVHYANIRAFGSIQAAAVLDYIFYTPIHIVSVISETVFQQSSRLKASYKCALADCIGLATAIELSGQFVTSNHHELEVVAENEPSFIFWFR